MGNGFGDAPLQWVFNDEDRKRYKDRFWRFPKRLVVTGIWRELWRDPETKRGGGAATSVLPILALHVVHYNTGVEKWSPWFYLSTRRIAKLAGINKDTVRIATRRLAQLDLLRTKRIHRDKYLGGYKLAMSLSSQCFPEEHEHFIKIYGSLFYAGAWAILPRTSCRHLYMILAALDPIGDEDAYFEKIALDFTYEDETDWGVLHEQYDLSEEPSDEEVQEILIEDRRDREVVSYSELEQHSGLSRSTVASALNALLCPVFGGMTNEETGETHRPIALIKTGDSFPDSPNWYVPNRKARGWYFVHDLMNDPDAIRKLQLKLWG
jgi:hypothetical protein